MADSRAAHQFDHALAGPFRPRQGFEKTAILVEPIDPLATIVIDTPFGEQRLTGAFYVVAEGDASYGATRHEFEQTHTAVSANRWVKNAPVTAYRTDVVRTVETLISGSLETTVTAQPGDWIVRQHTGEMMVLGPDEFAERYVSDEPGVMAPT
ncbi:MAG TPA: hypothetical protein VES40_20535 [Ilumatobacteraceae bacterium]|nr:hypothetical protein [Ilumatobacteraceae bacterium]